MRNVEFREGDLEALTGLDGEFDAVVGRLVLAYLSDPVGALRQATSLLRPGGLVCLHEADWTYIWSSLDTPTWQRLNSWVVDVLACIDTDLRMGPSLFATFRRGAAGPGDDHGSSSRRWRPCTGVIHAEQGVVVGPCLYGA